MLYPAVGLERTKDQWQAYRSSILECKWQATSVARLRSFDDSLSRLQNKYNLFNSTIPVHLCDTQVGERRWSSAKIGPLSSSGGYSWQELQVHPMFQQEGFPIFVTGALTVFVDSDMSLVGYPPLHNHHSLLFRGQGYADAVILNHQDSSCFSTTHFDGNLCNIMIFPESTGVLLEQSLNFIASANDVRPADSPSFSWYMLVALRIDKTFGRSLVMWRTNGFPGPVIGLKDQIIPTFRIRSGSSIAWTSSRVPITGRLLTFWLHSHTSHGLEEVWFINASPTDVGFARQGSEVEAGFIYPRCAPSTPNFGNSSGAIKRHLLTRMRERNIGFLCVGHHPTNISDQGDRQLWWSCEDGATSLTAGDYWTGIFFFNAAHETTPLQHIHYQGHVIPAENVPRYTVFAHNALPEALPMLGYRLEELEGLMCSLSAGSECGVVKRRYWRHPLSPPYCVFGPEKSMLPELVHQIKIDDAGRFSVQVVLAHVLFIKRPRHSLLL